GVQAAPGVRGAGLVNTLPLTGEVAKRSVVLEGYTPPSSSSAPLFWLHAVTPDYFTVMGIRVELGRPITRADLSGRPPVAIVTAAPARLFWRGETPIGGHLRSGGDPTLHTTVGVAAAVRAFSLARNVPGGIDGAAYVPNSPAATMEDGRIPADMTLVLK